MKKRLFFLCVVLGVFCLGFGQKKENLYVAFYNVENLFDTINTQGKEDYEFLPNSARKWNTQKYTDKLHKIARVIAALNDWKGPDVIGLCEVESRIVLDDLVTKTYLNQLGFGIVHKESPDKRGIDVALLYKKSKVKLLNVDFIEVTEFERPTRDILCSTLLVNKDTLTYIVSHWPSKYGGEAITAPKRKLVADKIRAIADSITAVNNKAKIIITGDFNDSPKQESVSKSLGAKSDSTSFLFNASNLLEEKGIYSYKYQHRASLIDQIVISNTLLNASKGWSYTEMEVFKPSWLLIKDERFGGVKPYRSYYGKQYQGGYSDHLPVCMKLEFYK